MSFDNELEFEKALVSELVANGWTNGILKNPTEKDLLDNWAQILFENNSAAIPLTKAAEHEVPSLKPCCFSGIVLYIPTPGAQTST